MTDYKDISYFADYFANLEDFKLAKEFVCKDHTFFGTIEAIGTIHPLAIQVHIPDTFPHHKLLFTTTSLKGYPHLIFSKEQGCSWFCLNTPFFENTKDQLDAEILRLRLWIKRMMSEDIPASINDPKIAMALALNSAFDWEIQNTSTEYVVDPIFNFVGDFTSLSNNFPSFGYLNTCVKKYSMYEDDFSGVTPGSYYVIRDENAIITTEEIETKRKSKNVFKDRLIPFLVVNRMPSQEEMTTLSSIKSAYNLSNDECLELFGLDITPHLYVSSSSSSKEEKPKEGEKTYKDVEEILKDNDIPSKFRALIKKDLENNIISQGGSHVIDNKQLSMTSEDWGEWIDGIYEARQFCLCVKNDTKYYWIVFSFNTNSNIYSRAKQLGSYKMAGGHTTIIIVESQHNCKLLCSPSKFYDYHTFFGRGSINKGLADCKIALLGAGAIGSILAESIVRSGITHIDVWDKDKVEAGNLCRSTYSINDLQENKADAIVKRIKELSPFCKATAHCFDFYGTVNYKSQEDVKKELEKYDLIIDCTASNELLHFLSYAFEDKHIISMSITNHAQDLLCISNADGNPYELRKHYLSKIEQDTQNFYVEGIGCYTPTFLALNSEVASLVNMAVSRINKNFDAEVICHSMILSNVERGVVIDDLKSFKLEDSDIKLSISTETLMDCEDLPDADDGMAGYLLGGYSADGKHIFVTHAISPDDAVQTLEHVYANSNGVIDYIGDIFETGQTSIHLAEKDVDMVDVIANKANDPSINTNNPLVAFRNADDTITFKLYIGGELVDFLPLN